MSGRLSFWTPVHSTHVFINFRKNFQKILAKQGMKFKLNTKVLSADKQADGTVVVKTEAANGGKEETFDANVVLVAVGSCYARSRFFVL